MKTRTNADATLNGNRILTTQDSSHMGYDSFFALKPGDNAATIALGAPVLFPQDGNTDGLGSVTRTAPGIFRFNVTGKYLVMFVVSVTEAGQLVITLSGTELSDCYFGRATTGTQIVGQKIISVTPGILLEIRNPAANAAALTITSAAGGTEPVCAQLNLLRLQ